MDRRVTRRRFGAGLAGTAGLLLPRSPTNEATVLAARERPDPLPADLVKRFVIKAHSDLPATRELLADHPGLLNACWDWGGGDFETGLEGAGHVGSRDVARFLISKGARPNIFVVAMLGELDLVKATLTAFPDLVHSKGPHGLTLLHHARQGKAEAEPVLEYLMSLGAE